MDLQRTNSSDLPVGVQIETNHIVHAFEMGKGWIYQLPLYGGLKKYKKRRRKRLLHN